MVIILNSFLSFHLASQLYKFSSLDISVDSVEGMSFVTVGQDCQLKTWRLPHPIGGKKMSVPLNQITLDGSFFLSPLSSLIVFFCRSSSWCFSLGIIY